MVLVLFFLVLGSVLYYLIPRNITPIADLVWESQISNIGIGSPRLADLNNDGITDVILGTGFEWSELAESSLLVVNGRTGKPLWQTETPAAVYGTSVLIDINNDNRPDVTATGRFADIYMLNGKDGAILWMLSEQNPTANLLPCNFNTPVLIPDQDNDGIDDIVVIQGGLAEGSEHIRIYDYKSGRILAEKYNREIVEAAISNYLKDTTEEELVLKLCRAKLCEIKSIHRSLFEEYTFDIFMSKLFFNQEGPGSRIYIVSSRTGHIIRYFLVPNERESWGVPIVFEFKDKGYLIYGSGGERIDGHLIAQDFYTGKIIWKIPIENKGVISSQVLYIENDHPIVVANTMNGDVLKVDALSGKIKWSKSVSTKYETYSSPAVLKTPSGYDIVSIFARGVWPKYDSSTLFIFDGQTGAVKFRKRIGSCNAASSPIIADVNNDNSEDIILVTCADRYSRLLIIDQSYNDIFEFPMQSGAFATPILSDTDNDAHLDLIVPRFHFLNRFRFKDLNTSSVRLNWNQYRGVNWSGRRLNFNN